MTAGKVALVTAGIVGVVALGVAMTPTLREEIREQWTKARAPMAETAPAPEPTAAPAPKKTERRVARTREIAPEVASEVARTKRAIAPMKTEPNMVQTIAPSVWEPELRDRVKAVLNPGSKPELAAADFASAEQFMTVAHAARNTKVPFMVLKHRVLTEGQSLDEAIHEFKPELDAKAEVRRARVAARADLDITG